MKKHIQFVVALALSLTMLSSKAQPGMRGGMGAGMGGAPSGPNFSGGMEKLFGEHQSFSATLEMHTTASASGGEVTVPGKLTFSEGSSRFEMDMTEIKGLQLKAQDAARMKQMGMANMIAITSREKKVSWVVYPGLQAYMEKPMPEANTTSSPSDYTVAETEMGKETVDGRDCVKKKVVVTNKEGKAHESLVWKSSEQKSFPVKIEATEGSSTVTMIFKDVKFDKPEASQFAPPAEFTKYNDMQSMMMQEMMKRRGGGRALPGQ